MKLYSIDAELAALVATADESGELNDDLARAIEACAIDRTAKLASLASIIRESELEAVAVQAELDRLEAKHKSLKGRAEYFKNCVVYPSMKAAGETKAKAGMFNFSIQNNGGLAPMAVHVEAEKLPAWAQSVKIEMNKAEIRKRLEAGEVLDFAELLERGEHLRIR